MGLVIVTDECFEALFFPRHHPGLNKGSKDEKEADPTRRKLADNRKKKTQSKRIFQGRIMEKAPYRTVTTVLRDSIVRDRRI